MSLRISGVFLCFRRNIGVLQPNSPIAVIVRACAVMQLSLCVECAESVAHFGSDIRLNIQRMMGWEQTFGMQCGDRLQRPQVRFWIC